MWRQVLGLVSAQHAPAPVLLNLQRHQVLSPLSIWALRKRTVPWDTGRWGEEDWKPRPAYTHSSQLSWFSKAADPSLSLAQRSVF